MKKYTFFVRRPDGAFSTHQTLPLPGESEARRHGEALCAAFGGCDVWDESRRISLLIAADAPRKKAIQ